MAQRYTVIGGIPKKKWSYLNEETRVKGFRIYRVRDNKTGTGFYAADFQLMGELLDEYRMVPIEDVETRRQAWGKAQEMLERIALPIEALRKA